PPTITSIDDIKTLMSNASMLGQVASAATPGSTQATLQAILADNPVAAGGQYWVYAALAAAKSAIAPTGTSTQGNDLRTTLPAVKRLQTLLERMRDLLSAPYSFTVYAEKSCNFGILVTYRQTWEPEQYQVGDLFKTIPLAPRETRLH